MKKNKVTKLVDALNKEAARWEKLIKEDADFGDYGSRRIFLAKRDAYQAAAKLVTEHLVS